MLKDAIMGHDIFVSYAAKDKLFADALVNKLENDGLRCWCAPRDIPAGADWPSATRQAIKQIPALLLIFSESANASQEVLRELTLASDHKSLVIPVRIENVPPSTELECHLNNRHWLDVYDIELEAALTRVVEGVQRYRSLFEKKPESLRDQQADALPVAPPPAFDSTLELRPSGKPYLIRLFVALLTAAIVIGVSFVVERWN